MNLKYLIMEITNKIQNVLNEKNEELEMIINEELEKKNNAINSIDIPMSCQSFDTIDELFDLLRKRKKHVA